MEIIDTRETPPGSTDFGSINVGGCFQKERRSSEVFMRVVDDRESRRYVCLVSGVIFRHGDGSRVWPVNAHVEIDD